MYARGKPQTNTPPRSKGDYGTGNNRSHWALNSIARPIYYAFRAIFNEFNAAFNLYVWMYDGGQNTYNDVVCTLEPHDVGRRMAVDGSP